MVPNEQQLEKMRSIAGRTATAAGQAGGSPWIVAACYDGSQEHWAARVEAAVAQASIALQQDNTAAARDHIDDHRASATCLTQQALAAVESEYGDRDNGQLYCLLRYLSTKQGHGRLAAAAAQESERHQKAAQVDTKDNMRNTW